MLNQVEKVLQMAQIEREEINLKLTKIDLHELIENAAINARLSIEQKEGLINTTFEAKDFIIEGDHTHLSNIIRNLLDNAEKYSDKSPIINIKTENYKNGIRISIQDNGIGISKESQKHIFDKFYRVHTGNRHDVKGFGLGLSYVKTILDTLGGNITVNSDLGKGSTFTIFLPKEQTLKK
jgi:two-component system phosphate regulon sensor histidine kinase PhoR